MIKRLQLSLFVFLVSLAIVPVANAFPAVETCKGALEPSKVNGCDGIGWEGCCDVTGRQFWCEGSDLFCVDCANGFPACGWNPFGYYDCGQVPMSEDPSGEHAYACGACSPECAEGAGCSAECPGGCGVCEGDGVCMDDGSCYVPQCGEKQCGNDPMGFSCGTCPAGESCVEEVGKCLALPQACVPHEGPGCDGCSCEACVCEAYPSCCTENWDLFCASACELECGYNCDACPAEPSCDGVECGDFCGVSCGSCGEGSVCLSGACCVPMCDGKNCGSDGCGSSCGACSGTDVCSNAGVCETCQPSCGDKECGDDGCGGSCGSCDDGYCDEGGQCASSACSGKCDKAKVNCGKDCECYCDEDCWEFGDCCDGICQVCAEKYEDQCCEPACADKQCGGDGCGGSCGTCDLGVCEAGQCVDCEPDCEGKQCGDDRCGGSCGTCDDDANCEAGQCVVCVPECNGKNCGADGCGGSCGTCGDGLTCGEDKLCISDGACGDISTQGCCWKDQTYFCGDNDQLLSTGCGEEACGWSAEQDRYTCGGVGEDPSGEVSFDCWDVPCATQCNGKNCGADGCGGSCGECGEDEFCNINQKCQEKTLCGDIPAIGCCLDNVLFYCQSDSQVIELNCGLEPCGWDTNALDGAGSYTCGIAGAEPSGKEGHSCDGNCYPVCHGKTCGGDGCGGSCGTCEEGIECIDNQCFDASVCVPSCIEKQCGNDGCGGSCGDCPPDAGCTVSGLCAYIDDCDTIGYEGVCAGDRIYWCEGGKVYTYDCDEIDKTCDTTEGVGQSCVDPPLCEGSCDGRTCGDDGCGGSCGDCESGQSCFEGACGLGSGGSTTLSGTKSDSGCGGGPAPWTGATWLALAGLALAYSRTRRAG